MKVQELETWKEQCKKSKEEAKVIKEKVQFQSAIVKVWFYKIIQQRTQNLWNWIVCSCSRFSHLSEEKFEIAIWGCLVLPTSKPLTSKDNSGKIMFKNVDENVVNTKVKTWHKAVLNIARRQNSKISQDFGCIGEMFHVKEWKCSKDKKCIKWMKKRGISHRESKVSG